MKTRFDQPDFVPAGWPVSEPDLFMSYVGAILVIRIGPAFPASSFTRYLAEWARSVDARPSDAAVFAMYDLPSWPGMTAVQRQEWAAMLKSRHEMLQRTTRGMLLATPSPITRGAARAIFWLAPPPYAYAIVDTPRTAFRYIAEQGGPPAEGALRVYDEMVKKHWRPVAA